ncbi:MAG: phage tail sheath subtilisin-like domain-containing protein [Bacteroidota bacterium]
MAKVFSTPGVYIEEKNAFSSSIAAVPTAIPAFVGYTEKAIRGRKSLKQKPTRVESMTEFLDLFGGAPKTTFNIAPDEETDYQLTVDEGTQYYLYNSIKLFYDNGGGACYVCSAGDYSSGVGLDDLKKGLDNFLKLVEPTMVVIPDAVLLIADECYSLQKSMIQHSGFEMRNRVAILDVHGGHEERTMGEDDVVDNFRNGVGDRNLAFAAAYYPWVHSTVTAASEVSSRNISNTDGLQGLLEKEADDGLAAGILKEKRFNAIKAEVAKLSDEKANLSAVHKTLNAVSPLFKEIMNDLRKELNVMPPSGAVAGLFAYVDANKGVSRPPANVSLNSVVATTVDINNENQEDLNLPLNGKAVNAIRGFFGKGVLVWGARTMDGNSNDWRYISVRRAVLMIEESIKNALGAFIFEPNVQNTWLDVKGAISAFLTTQWSNGVLMGATPEEAFSVDIGLGVTMSPQDVLDGIMRISVKLAVVRPAEFIVVTFQQMLSAGGAGTESTETGTGGGGDTGGGGGEEG